MKSLQSNWQPRVTLNHQTPRRKRTKVFENVLYSGSPWFESRPGNRLTNFLTSRFPFNQIHEECNSILTDWLFAADTCVWQSVVIWTEYNYKTLRNNMHFVIYFNVVATNSRKKNSKTQNDFCGAKLFQWQVSPGHVNSRIMTAVICFHCDETRGLS